MYCCTPKALYNHVGGLSSTTTSVQHPLGWYDGCHRTMAPVRSPHTSYRWRGVRVIEPIKWMGIIRRPWWSEARGGNLARTPGLHTPTLFEKCHGIFNDHSESGPRFNVSSPLLLNAEGASTRERPVSFPCMHAGVLVGPGRERIGIPRRQSCWTRGPDENRIRYTADGPGCRAV